METDIMRVCETLTQPLQLASLECNIDRSLSSMKSIPIEDLVNGAIGKRHANFKTPRKRHHDYKLQRVSYRTIDSLNLDSTTISRSISISLSGIDPNRLDSICITSGRGTLLSSREHLLLNSGRSLHSSTDETIMHKDSSRSNVSQSALYTGSKLVERNNAPLLMEDIADLSSCITSSPELSYGAHETDGAFEVQGIVNRIQQATTSRSTAAVTRSAGWSITSQFEDRGYVESDCEAYCSTKDKEPLNPIESYRSGSPGYPEKIAPFDISSAVTSSCNCATVSERCYTYSPTDNFGVLRLFLQTDNSGVKPSDTGSIPNRVVINKTPFLIGSENSCDLYFEREKYKQVFGKHCKIVFTPCEQPDDYLKSLRINSYLVELIKLSQEARLFVNNIPVRTRVTLTNGDVITLCPRKVGISFIVAFRSLEACISLLDHLNLLMLSPVEPFKQLVDTAEVKEDGATMEPEALSQSESALLSLESNVNIAVFELYYGNPSLDIGDATPCSYIDTITPSYILTNKTDNPYDQDNNSDFTPLIEKVTEFNVVGHHSDSDDTVISKGDKPPNSPLRMRINDCIISGTDIMSHHYADDTSKTSRLLLSAYTTGMRRVDVEETETKHQSYYKNQDENFRRMQAFKVARLRALNRDAFPIVVDSSRSQCSDQDSSRMTVQKMRYLGAIKGTYNSTLDELIPDLYTLLEGNGSEQISNERPYFDILLKRMEAPLSEEECRYNWVFQLAFFDKDDGLFRRAIYTSQRQFETDKYKLRLMVDNVINQLKQSRVLYIQRREF